MYQRGHHPSSCQTRNLGVSTDKSPTCSHTTYATSKDSAPYPHYTLSQPTIISPGQPYFSHQVSPYIQASFIIPLVARTISSKHEASCIPQLLKPLLWLPTFLRTEAKSLTQPARFQVVIHYLPLQPDSYPMALVSSSHPINFVYFQLYTKTLCMVFPFVWSNHCQPPPIHSSDLHSVLRPQGKSSLIIRTQSSPPMNYFFLLSACIIMDS